MKSPQRILLLFLFIFCSFGAHSQRITEFSKENEAFISELAGFMNDSRKKEGKAFIENEFAPVFYGGGITIQQQIKINKICNLLLEKKKKAYPEFHDYLLAVMAFEESGRPEEVFNEWDAVLTEVLDEKKLKKIHSNFIENSIGMFQNNTFFKSKSVAWKSSNSNWKFTFEDKQPVINFESLDLVCLAKGDSAVIYNTKGTFYPKTETWVGSGGRVTWLRAEFDPNTTYAEFQDYDIRIKGSNFTVENVLFHNEFFDEPLLGKLTEKVLANRTGEDASYPRFESYELRLLIKDIFKNMDYIGGFAMEGNKLIGRGTNEIPASIIVHREGQEFLVLKSKEFAIRPNKISSQSSSVSFRIEEDSISHPELIFKFDEPTRKLSLISTGEGLSKSPYKDSYHNIDMYVEALYWNIDDPLIELSTIKGSTQHYAAFESKDFYNDLRYDALMGREFTHPLVELRDYAKYIGSDEFPAYDYALWLRFGLESIHKQLIDLANKGFVDYDIETQYVKIKQKLYDTLLRNAGKNGL